MHTLTELKKRGYRLTKPRQELLRVLSQYPHTVQEIADILKSNNIVIDLASIYRSLDIFVDMGIVHVIELGGDKKRYELVDDTHHHHHLICNTCGKIEDITLNENMILHEASQKSSFKIDHHHLEFFGQCQKCQ